MNWNKIDENLPNIKDHIIVLFADNFECTILSGRFLGHRENEYGIEAYIGGKRASRKFIKDTFLMGWLPFSEEIWNKLHRLIINYDNFK